MLIVKEFPHLTNWKIQNIPGPTGALDRELIWGVKQLWSDVSPVTICTMQW